VAYAIGEGAVLVASTGNDGDTRDGSLVAPVNCPGVLGVGAIDVDARPWSKTQRSSFADVAAPGVHMRTVDVRRRPAHSDGTSDATALASGAVALVWSRYPTLTNRQVVARLLATVRDTGEAGKDDRTGYGIVRPYQAITTDVPADAPNPVFDELQAVATTASASARGADAPDASVPGGLPGWLPRALVAGVVVVAVLVAAVGVAVALGRRRGVSRP
jgi:subtilisin family serine protease